MKEIGIIGCGNVATEVLRSELKIEKNIYIYDINIDKSFLLAELFPSKKITVCSSIKEVIRYSDLVLEAASVDAVGEILSIIKNFKNKKLVILSVGGLIKNFKLYKYLIQNDYKIFIPSGAIAGLDALQAAKISGINSIFLRTIKPKQSLLSAPYFVKNKSVLKKIMKSSSAVVFRGDIYKAIKYFPQNINVAATLAVVSERPDKIEVEIIAKDNINKNIHEVTINSNCAKIYTRTENFPSPSNPKTSYLAALSTISNLKLLIEK